jgi:thioesterase domain-containing protein
MIQPQSVVVAGEGSVESVGGLKMFFRSLRPTLDAVDLRGRGKSDGERFYVETFDDYVSDVAQCVAVVRAREPGLPVFLLGHSAGGVVACLFALARRVQGIEPPRPTHAHFASEE